MGSDNFHVNIKYINETNETNEMFFLFNIAFHIRHNFRSFYVISFYSKSNE